MEFTHRRHRRQVGLVFGLYDAGVEVSLAIIVCAPMSGLERSKPTTKDRRTSDKWLTELYTSW